MSETKMIKFARIVPFAALLAVAGCASTSEMAQRPMLGAPSSTATTDVATAAPVAPSPAEATSAAALAATDIAKYVDAAAIKVMSTTDQRQASSAQFYALQFGRPGAPRAWAGDSGAVGSVTVGPYVRVNNLDCRDFTHTVTIKGQSFAHKGTACREQGGTWSVTASSSGAA
jgi:surface antigen